MVKLKPLKPKKKRGGFRRGHKLSEYIKLNSKKKKKNAWSNFAVEPLGSL